MKKEGTPPSFKSVSFPKFRYSLKWFTEIYRAEYRNSIMMYLSTPLWCWLDIHVIVGWSICTHKASSHANYWNKRMYLHKKRMSDSWKKKTINILTLLAFRNSNAQPLQIPKSGFLFFRPFEILFWLPKTLTNLKKCTFSCSQKVLHIIFSEGNKQLKLTGKVIKTFTFFPLWKFSA